MNANEIKDEDEELVNETENEEAMTSANKNYHISMMHHRIVII